MTSTPNPSTHASEASDPAATPMAPTIAKEVRAEPAVESPEGASDTAHAAGEPPLTGAAAEEALQQLDATLAEAAESLADDGAADAGVASETTTVTPQPVAVVGEPPAEEKAGGADVEKHESETASELVAEVADAITSESASSSANDQSEFETAADVVAQVAATAAVVPESVVQAATVAAQPTEMVASTIAKPIANETNKPNDTHHGLTKQDPAQADAKPAGSGSKQDKPQSSRTTLLATVQTLATKAAVGVFAVLALPLRLVGDSARTMVGLFAGATLATAGIVWGMVLFSPPPKSTSPVEKLLAIAEKEREAKHGEADGGGHGAAAGGHGEKKAAGGDSHGAKPAKKDDGHGGGHGAKPAKKKEAAHAPAKKPAKAGKKKDDAHGGGH